MWDDNHKLGLYSTVIMRHYASCGRRWRVRRTDEHRSGRKRQSDEANRQNEVELLHDRITAIKSCIPGISIGFLIVVDRPP